VRSLRSVHFVALVCAAWCLLAGVAAAQEGRGRHHRAAPTVVADAAAEPADAAVVEPAPVAPVVAPPAAANEADALTGIPLGRGLPVVVRVGVAFIDVSAIDENEGTFTATIDLRLRWNDPRLGFPAADAPGGFHELRGPAVEARLGEIWSPDARLANRVGDATNEVKGLRVSPNGDVELMLRTTGQFRTDFDVERFPFDRQQLGIQLLSQRDSDDLVTLDYRQDDLDFSAVGEGLTLPGWTPGLVNIRRDPLVGWHGESHARVWFSLEMGRVAGRTAAAIFIPLFASLLIPLLAMWLNRFEDGEFKIEAFELTNVVIGGLFAVIALNFTVNSEYRQLGAGDNTVARLFTLNYVTLAASLGVNIALFRFNVVARLFGRPVQGEVFAWLLWAVPLLALGTALAFVFVALA
jgi:hypothetical protein